eukprot:TRINITY_DN2806_c0_g1_i2.p1 TRINITY_DN2806_c0_g1~~TRINITY_DN2806_c0_g1_i2.p1  ORF type:complete len:356 (+),score=78.76 TRINITY_DN2806_c0_g1_i2:55-1122(+)
MPLSSGNSVDVRLLDVRLNVQRCLLVFLIFDNVSLAYGQVVDNTTLGIMVALGLAAVVLGIIGVLLLICRKRLELAQLDEETPDVRLISEQHPTQQLDVNQSRWKSVKDVGVQSVQNTRRTMEDEHTIVDGYCRRPLHAYFGVYDGHGGRAVAKYVAQHLHEDLAERLLEGGEVLDNMQKAYAAIDSEVLNDTSMSKAGCTAVSVLLMEEDGERYLFVANVGDARAVLNHRGAASRLTFDHKASSPSERERLGQVVFHDKVAGVLAVSRAFGNKELKKYVIAEPYLNSTGLGPDDTHLILACDGVWDVCDDQQAVDLVQLWSSEGKDAQTMSELLVQYAIDNKSSDNITAIVVCL